MLGATPHCMLLLCAAMCCAVLFYFAFYGQQSTPQLAKLSLAGGCDPSTHEDTIWSSIISSAAGSPTADTAALMAAPSPQNPIKVGIVTVRSPSKNHEGKHFLIDGVVGSSHLSLHKICVMGSFKGCPVDVLKDTPATAAIHDDSDFEDIAFWIVHVCRVKTEENPDRNLAMRRMVWYLSARWKVLLVDFADYWQDSFYENHLFNAELAEKGWGRAVGPAVKYEYEYNGDGDDGDEDREASRDAMNIGANFSNLHLAVRSRVDGRHWNSTLGLQVTGFLCTELDEFWSNHTGNTPVAMPYAVRGDTVQELHELVPFQSLRKRVISTELRMASLRAGFLDRPPPHTDRPMDVIHLWRSAMFFNYGLYRSNVSAVIERMDNQPLQIDGNGQPDTTSRTIRASTKLQGQRGKMGRNFVEEAYILALLQSKIVVVTQRDEWEDHYRLFESMASGALVIHDTMLSPPRGVVDGTSIVFFESLEDLERKIVYYLQHEEERLGIAERGWMVAMGQHRSWHRVEEVVFGCPLTNSF
uniref:Spore protein YkvP/CgeB glycosyl transferase-like domain-containing protein n=1 Tax=Craspedostauros australis TaxID=1486917 RepID=A0A7R9WX64_9STRA|mmetsp:Transcript_22983/g.64030  ORF Transcript_22983/g.64030 Transcript_22983/m.64030 type:complete len:528 (+) Transcript_22983:119-1702(+)